MPEVAYFYSATLACFYSALDRFRALEPVHCFEGEIRQVISNLVGNGLDAMSANGGRLWLRTRLATHWPSGEKGVAITVADSGTGISDAAVGKLFNPFFTTKGLLGTGLGLWVSKEIIDRHRGVLRLRTRQTVGKSGTVFTIFLPFRAVER